MCSGTELTLLDCTYNRTGDENDHSRDVIVHCQQRKVTYIVECLYKNFVKNLRDFS